MKFAVQQQHFAKALSTVGRSIAAKATLPALSGVLMEVEGEELLLSGSNLETAIRVKVPIQSEGEGVFLVGAKLLSDYVHSLPNGEIICESVGNTLQVVKGKITSSFVGMSYDEYPELGFEGHKTPYNLPGEVFAQAIEHVSMAASTDDARAILTGLQVHVENGVFELAATDGFRLAVEKMDVGLGEQFSLVLPSKVMIELSRLIRECESGTSEKKIMCGKTAEGTQMLFVLPNGVQLISRLLEGAFPPYQKIIPTSYATRVSFLSEALIAEVKRAALFGAVGTQMLKLDLQKGHTGGKAVFHSVGNQVGEYHGEIEVSLEGSDNQIAFNARYLLDFLSKIKSKEVVLEMNRPDTPGLWCAVGLEEYRYVVMPMNL